jgi:hypothetical protein
MEARDGRIPGQLHNQQGVHGSSESIAASGGPTSRGSQDAPVVRLEATSTHPERSTAKMLGRSAQ